jgi:hypothetical protein
MLAFLDFEASSLAERSYPIEVGWVFEDGAGEAHLIRPAPGWTDWSDEAQAIHGIDRAELLAKGASHAEVARRMVDVLTGHTLCASAPSWDGKWLSALLRAAGLPRHALRLRKTDDVLAETARAILAPVTPAEALAEAVTALIARVEQDAPCASPAHRALADAEQERQRWLQVCSVARTAVGTAIDR